MKTLHIGLRIGSIAAGLAAMLLMTACQRHGGPTADHGWVRLPVAAGRPGAAYFTLHGGKTEEVLTQVSAPFATRAEMHEMQMAKDGAMTMAPLARLDLPAGSEIRFTPGGKHVMLYDIAATLKAGDTTSLTLSFASGRQIRIKAKVIAAGAAEPKE